MNVHKNARTTPQSRAVLVHRVLEQHWPVSIAAQTIGVPHEPSIGTTHFQCVTKSAQ